ncbi:TonB-dependent receptor family protein [Ideonella sp.]|uniref:TonB-dependent receptor family protein n=1 Tax=Ideonella sp. TaxID=1929293 RepID=UPI0035B013E7
MHAAPPPDIPLADPANTSTVVVVGTRLREDAFTLPLSVDRLEADELHGHRPQVSLSEALAGVAGVQARDRQNFAQDVQLSVRGFGARASFGLRGVRLIVDGIPATMPDGQGQLSHVDIGAARSVEVLRGPFSALYGHSSGGVIVVQGDDPVGEPEMSASLTAGTHGLHTGHVQLQGGGTTLAASARVSAMRTDGVRTHSAAQRTVAEARLAWRPDGADPQGDRVVFQAQHFRLPLAQDPLGLTRAQFESDPGGADPAALAFDTRKWVEQAQAGATWTHRAAGPQRLSVMAYAGHRRTVQFQAIPVAPQENPQHPGGVIDLTRRYHGSDLRWTWDGRATGGSLTWALGLAADVLDEDRRGHENFVGETLGVRGALRRDERNRATTVDPYLQATWQPDDRWRVDAGMRHSRVQVRSEDRYVRADNGDDSGRVRFAATLPALAVGYRVTPGLRWYAAVGRGFETPTLNELAYRSDGSAGLNAALRPASSRHAETGLQWQPGPGLRVSVAAFAVQTADELVTRTNLGGRASFQNAGRTRRDGLELGATARRPGGWQARAALTWVDARYTEGFLTCGPPPCTEPDVPVPAGRALPGVAPLSAFLAWQRLPEAGWQWSLEARHVGRVPVNDRHTDHAAAFSVASASAGFRWPVGGGGVEAFLRSDNLFDRRYAGSVIVNEGNGRFFEPGPGRTWLAGVRWQQRF